MDINTFYFSVDKGPCTRAHARLQRASERTKHGVREYKVFGKCEIESAKIRKWKWKRAKSRKRKKRSHRRHFWHSAGAAGDGGVGATVAARNWIDSSIIPSQLLNTMPRLECVCAMCVYDCMTRCVFRMVMPYTHSFISFIHTYVWNRRNLMAFRRVPIRYVRAPFSLSLCLSKGDRVESEQKPIKMSTKWPHLIK